MNFMSSKDTKEKRLMLSTSDIEEIKTGSDTEKYH